MNDTSSLLTSITETYNRIPTVNGVINYAYEKLGKNLENLDELPIEPFGGEICGLALIALEPENVKPRITYDATLICDRDSTERINRNGSSDYPKASKDLIISSKRIIQIALIIFPPADKSNKNDPLRIIYEFAIKGLEKLSRTYKNEGQSKATVELLGDCIEVIQFALNGIIPDKPKGEPVKEQDIQFIKSKWSHCEIETIAKNLIRGGKNLQESKGDYNSCEIQRQAIKYIILQQCKDYREYKKGNTRL